MKRFLAAFLSTLFTVEFVVGAAAAQDFLYSEPRLVVDTGLHAGASVRIAAAPDAGVAVSGGEDKVLRVWALDDGALEMTIRIPRGPGYIGKINAVAIPADGSLIAASGWTGSDVGPYSIYLFDRAGTMVHRIGDLPKVVMALAFSPDGGVLAATLGSSHGLRIFARSAGWAETARDDRYDSDSYGVTFSPDGRPATTDMNGTVRIYDRDGRNPVTGGDGVHGAFGLAFSPDGESLAVGNAEKGRVAIYDARTLAPRAMTNLGRFAPDSLPFVAWSLDGESLYSAGFVRKANHNMLLTWTGGGRATPRAAKLGFATIGGLAGLSGGKVLAATTDPWLGVIDADGVTAWERRTDLVDVSSLVQTLAVSSDGAIVDFDFGRVAPVRMRFDTRTLKLSPAPQSPTGMATPDQTSLGVKDWDGSNRPVVNGHVLSLGRKEFSRSVAADPVRGRIVLGSDWHLAAYDASGVDIWRKSTPSVPWAVNIADQGRLAVVAYADGSIRWYDIDNNGAELLALLVSRTVVDSSVADRPPGWIVWTPDGLYETAASSFAQLYWHLNHGADVAAQVYPASAIAGTNRPDVIPYVLSRYGTAEALGPSDYRALPELLERVRLVTGAETKPGAVLHVLAVGVGDIGAGAASLKLAYAARDAEDLVARLKETQDAIYSRVRLGLLTDKDASKRSVLDALDSLHAAMERGDNDGRDFAVIEFSGHGMFKDGHYYLLTYGSDPSGQNSIAATALDLGLVADKVRAISKLGRVLVLIDACRSSAYAADNSPLQSNADYLKELLEGEQVNVVVSSASGELSWESKKWQHGVFTEAVLEALSKRADANNDSMISTSEFVGYVGDKVSTLTGGAQNPSPRIAYSQKMFFAARDELQ